MVTVSPISCASNSAINLVQEIHQALLVSPFFISINGLFSINILLCRLYKYDYLKLNLRKVSFQESPYLLVSSIQTMKKILI